MGLTAYSRLTAAARHSPKLATWMVTAHRKLSLGRITLLGLNGCSGGADLVSNASASIPSTINQAERLLPYLTNSHFVPSTASRFVSKQTLASAQQDQKQATCAFDNGLALPIKTSHPIRR